MSAVHVSGTENDKINNNTSTAGLVKAKSVQLHEIDEKARIEQAPKQPGLCVDEICNCNLHYCYPSTIPTPFDGTTTYKVDYGNKFIGEVFPPVQYTLDNPPEGVDLNEWKKYIAKHGLPKPGQIPSLFFYQKTPETRDFATESRLNYDNKFLGNQNLSAFHIDKDTPPPGVDIDVWREYVAKHGVPPIDKIPQQLHYKKTPDLRDFATQYRSTYIPHSVDVCPINVLPPYPKAEWPRQHKFWDPIAKCWY